MIAEYIFHLILISNALNTSSGVPYRISSGAHFQQLLLHILQGEMDKLHPPVSFSLSGGISGQSSNMLRSKIKMGKTGVPLFRAW